jgi:hypothetical protein
MITELQDQHRTADIYFFLTHAFDRLSSKFSTFSPAQREAVRQFLRLQLAEPNEAFDHPEIE